MQNLKIAFINPPHADWSLANNMTYLQCQSHYQREGKYPDKVTWIEAPYKWNQYTHIEQVYEELKDADIFLFSSYTWNSDILDEICKYITKRSPDALRVLGGPHIGTNEPSYLEERKKLYHLISKPTKPGEVFIEDLINSYIEKNEAIPSSIAWELRSDKCTTFDMVLNYSIYEDHEDYLKKTVEYARENKMEPFVILETTRGCPYKCVYCEWGGGISTKILKKPIEIVERDILALKRIGFRDAYLTDANFGAFVERDFQIFKFAWENNLNLTDISTVKTPNLEKRKKLIDYWFDIIGSGPEKHSIAEGSTDMWEQTEYVSIVPTISIQSVSDTAMKIAKRIDLKSHDKIKLSEYINFKCREQGYPVPALELILAMPGSTIEDFYEEMNIIWNFQAWSSFRHDYMFLPDAELNSPDYIDKYAIETTTVYSDIVDEDGIDNWNSLYKDKRNYFKTIRSCFSFSANEMIEMWFMNNAANYILQNFYPQLEELTTPSIYSKLSFQVISQIEDFKRLLKEIHDIYDPNTPPKSIRKLEGDFRVNTIEKYLKKHEFHIKNEVFIQLTKQEKLYGTK